jgi:hypothetical protein
LLASGRFVVRDQSTITIVGRVALWTVGSARADRWVPPQTVREGAVLVAVQTALLARRVRSVTQRVRSTHVVWERRRGVVAVARLAIRRGTISHVAERLLHASVNGVRNCRVAPVVLRAHNVLRAAVTRQTVNSGTIGLHAVRDWRRWKCVEALAVCGLGRITVRVPPAHVLVAHALGTVLRLRVLMVAHRQWEAAVGSCLSARTWQAVLAVVASRGSESARPVVAEAVGADWHLARPIGGCALWQSHAPVGDGGRDSLGVAAVVFVAQRAVHSAPALGGVVLGAVVPGAVVVGRP